MKKTFFFTLTILLLLFSFTGCKKVTNTYELRVNAVIEETYHENAWRELEYSPSSKKVRTINHPEVNITAIRYNGKRFVLNNKNTYNYCEDKVGQSVPCILEVKEYDDGSTKEEIVAVVLGGQ